MMRLAATRAITGLALLLGACGGPKELAVDDAWVRLAAVSGRPAAGYFTLHGGATDATLIALSADLAIRTEMHESMGTAGVMSMRPIASVAVPAGGTVAFAPGGRHAMLFDVAPSVKPGDAIMLSFAFADGRRLHRKAAVIAAGDPAPPAD